MKADILTKENISTILLECNYKGEKIQEIFDVLNGMEKESGIPVLGYTINTMKCSLCGAVHGSVHPIPMKYPSECETCGQMSCFVE